jgi:hypothetical protein
MVFEGYKVLGARIERTARLLDIGEDELIIEFGVQHVNDFADTCGVCPRALPAGKD